jgi:hypothetical protein
MAVATARTATSGAQRSGHPLRSRWLVVIRETVFIAAAALFYSLVRGLTDDRVPAAFDNAERVISFERSVDLFAEADLQRIVLRTDPVIDVVNAIYIAYWPLIFGTLAWLLVCRPVAYPFYRNALLASGALTLGVFAVFPLAPPRFLPDHGFVDTIAGNSAGYREFTASALVNEYAAMPSLHFGWTLLVAVAVVTLVPNIAIRAAAGVIPALMFAAIVLTGNHYIIDGLVGSAVVLAGLGVAAAIRSRTRTRPGGRRHAVCVDASAPA